MFINVIKKYRKNPKNKQNVLKNVFKKNKYKNTRYLMVFVF